MARYIQLDVARFEDFLSSKRMLRTVRGNEVVYVREHSKFPNVFMAVYTSIAEDADHARGRGADAIRVVAYYNDNRGKSFGVYRGAKVLRVTSTEEVIRRTYERMREAAITVNKRFTRP